MNKVILIGRLARDPDVRYGGANGDMAVARYTIAVNRTRKREGDPESDFFNCVSFGKLGEFVDRYLHKGTKIIVDGELRNNNYTNKDGQKVYAVEVIASNVEFAESKAASERYASSAGGSQTQTGGNAQEAGTGGGGFVEVPDGMVLPF